MRPARLFIFLSVCLTACLTRPASAYLTSARLEYSASNHVTFYLNGVSLTSRDSGDDHWLDYSVLSSADGSLPLTLFRNGVENVLAAKCWNSGPLLTLSYRLTLRHSNGDDVVVWSEPGVTRVLNIRPGKALPADWFLPAYADGSWPSARLATPELAEHGVLLERNPYKRGDALLEHRIQSPQGPLPPGSEAARDLVPSRTPIFDSRTFLAPELPDPHFKGYFGARGQVPFVTHGGNGWSPAQTHDLFRSRFRFPGSLFPPSIVVDPPSGRAGSRVKFSVQAGPDVTGLKHMQLAVDLPEGLEARALPMDADYDKKGRRISWSLSPRLQYRQLFLNRVVDARGWSKPEEALGGIKPYKKKPGGLAYPEVSEWEFLRGAQFQSGLTGWFGFAPSGITPSAQAPPIVGVIFHSQVLPRGINTLDTTSMDRVLFNYSVDGSDRGVLASPADVNTLVKDDYYTDAYYDATQDRAWTWEDIDRLRVSFKASQKGDRKTDNILASCDVNVAFLRPGDLSRSAEAFVQETRCRSLSVKGMVLDEEGGTQAFQEMTLPVNPGLCPTPAQAADHVPTPLPTRTVPLRTVLPTAVVPGRSPTPTPVMTATPAALPGLANLQSQPEPFTRGGVMIYFDLKKPATVSLTVRHGNQAVRTTPAYRFNAGSNQLFYNGLDDKGRPLARGGYTYELTATADGVSQASSSHFTRIADPPSNR